MQYYQLSVYPSLFSLPFYCFYKLSINGHNFEHNWIAQKHNRQGKQPGQVNIHLNIQLTSHEVAWHHCSHEEK